MELKLKILRESERQLSDVMLPFSEAARRAVPADDVWYKVTLCARHRRDGEVLLADFSLAPVSADGGK
jgi:hypothetical protein